MNASEFVRKWRKADLSERSASQQHFLDLCELVGHPKPAEADPTGESFTFERGARKRSGGDGWADVWKKGFFGWEYKGRHKDLDAACAQLLQYCEALENPPLLVVCDMDLIRIHTHFTNAPTEVHELRLDDLLTADGLDTLRAVFHDPEKLHPTVRADQITAEAAARIAGIAQGLRDRGLEPEKVARFLDRIVFCFFAEDIRLLPDNLLTQILDKTWEQPDRFGGLVAELFSAMAHGGSVFLYDIRHFNGDLFTDAGTLELTTDEIKALREAAELDWSEVDPSIFGTLFERGLDPAKRSQLGAHYTSREDILTLVEPVVMAPLRREWAETKRIVESLLTTGRKTATTEDTENTEKRKKKGKERERGTAKETARETETGGSRSSVPSVVRKLSPARMRKARMEADRILQRFHERLCRVKVLDPACGSGNFLYVTLRRLKDLEKEVIIYASEQGLGPFIPRVGPWQLYGIEINRYAFELAQMVVWIGYLQWVHANGFGITGDPVLRPMQNNFRCMDAILDLTEAANDEGRMTKERRGHEPEVLPRTREEAVRVPENRETEAAPLAREPVWPKVDFIVGNPPFLGTRFLRRELGDEYVDRLHSLWQDRLGRAVDLCCYWFEKARAQIEKGRCRRAGLLATQAIRGGANREVLKRIKESGEIFFAESDRPWILDGANVHVSMVGFDDGEDAQRLLDGCPATAINTNLSSAADVTQARRLTESTSLAFMGTTKQGAFDIEDTIALPWLAEPNPQGCPNSDVLVPWLNGRDVTKGSRSMWIIDLFVLSQEEAAFYALPYAYLDKNVRLFREASPRDWYRSEWWQLYAQRADMRKALGPLRRFLVTPRVTKHRLFAWVVPPCCPDCQLIVFARSDDYFFGVLHSRLHEVWARAQGTQLRERESGFRYTPTTCFETFAFPWPPGEEDQDDPLVRDIAAAAKELNDLRERWLNPPEWTRTEVLEFPGTIGGPWDRFIVEPPAGTGCGSPVPQSWDGKRNLSPETTDDGSATDTPRIGMVRYPRLVPRDEDCAKKLKKRTLTNLYNERPTWLDLAHRRLDEAVCAAYAAASPHAAAAAVPHPWTADMTDEAILENLLALNLERAGGD